MEHPKTNSAVYPMYVLSPSICRPLILSHKMYNRIKSHKNILFFVNKRGLVIAVSLYMATFVLFSIRVRRISSFCYIMFEIVASIVLNVKRNFALIGTLEKHDLHCNHIQSRLHTCTFSSVGLKHYVCTNCVWT